MTLRRTSAALLCAATLLAACAPAPRQAAPAGAPQAAAAGAQAEYDRFAREFLDWYYEASPVRATRLGIHRHDDRLQDLSRAGIERRREALHGWLRRLEGIDRAALRGDARLDHRVLEHAIRAQLLELEEVRGWERDPGTYVGAVSGGTSALSSRTFAPADQRMRSMMARWEQVPDVLAAARANLRDVPRLWAESAAGSARGTASFLRSDLPRALAEQGLERVDPALRAEWDAARLRTAARMEEFAGWLRDDLAPRAQGDFRLGRDVFERKLKYEEHVDLSADELREVNERAIRDYKAWVAREAARVDPRRDPAAVMDSITGIYPPPERLIATARAQLDTIRRFIVERGIVTLPSERMPTVRETPAYARGGFASMDTPGPFETAATEAYYNITNVDPAWTPEQKAQHMTYFNYPGLLGITVHEAMPGHFVQLLYEQQVPTEVRKVFTPSSLVEGWAHYAEQMMVDEGLGGGDPAVRLGQLRRALQRHARWHAGLAMHAYGGSVEDAAERYQEIAYFAPFPALREVQRGTSDPTYLYYALGRMQILKLREDYRRRLESQGKPFSLREFHDTFLRLGLPVSLAREVMIPGDAGPVL
ncbi:MAG TPA: DUF885 domain-containing protein [Longimicrobiaceae bacterium]|nr:DUF885 domain-containing protein [Longimicrobiaceae bacterium]